MGIQSVGMPVTNDRIIEKFFNSIDERESKEKCWNWISGTKNNGYAFIGFGKHKGPNYYHESAHRLSYRMHYGHDIPEGMCVCHKCDNKKCVNPFHLFLGTQMDNMRDKIAKGRDARGEKHSTATKLKTPKGSQQGQAKLHEKDIPIILEMRRDGMLIRQIAEHFHVSKTCISQIFKGSHWSHVSGIKRRPYRAL